MKTILAFINFGICLFNTTISILTFSIADEVEYRPEKGLEFTDTIKTFFPFELCLHALITFSALAQGNWFQLIIFLPGFVHNLKYYLEKKYLLYCSLGETKKDYLNISFEYKVKFIYYMCLALLSLLKFIVCLTDMLSYKIFGDTYFFFNVIKFIGLN